jgi:hypothetical protein
VLDNLSRNWQNLLDYLSNPFPNRRSSLALKSTFLAAGFSAVLTAPVHGEIAPSGGFSIQQPSGVYYIFVGNGTQSGGGFYYLNYVTHEFDIIMWKSG